MKILLRMMATLALVVAMGIATIGCDPVDNGEQPSMPQQPGQPAQPGQPGQPPSN